MCADLQLTHNTHLLPTYIMYITLATTYSMIYIALPPPHPHIVLSAFYEELVHALTMLTHIMCQLRMYIPHTTRKFCVYICMNVA